MNNLSFLKLCACLFMLVDHVGVYLFPDVLSLRIVGRIAFPLFAYSLVQGYFLTRNLSLYLMRVLSLAVIWQLFYTFFVYYGYISSPPVFNVIFTLYFGLLAVYFLDYEKYFYVLFILVFSLLLDLLGFGFEYGLYGIALIISLYFIRLDFYGKYVVLFLSVILNIVFISLGVFNWVQYFSSFAFLLLFFDFNCFVSMPRYFYYLFYPLHFLFIFFLRYAYF